MKTSQIPKPKSSFQNHVSFLQTITKPPFRSKTPPNVIPNNSKIYVNTTVNYDDDSDELLGENPSKNRQYTECNSNSSRRIPSKNNKKQGVRVKKDEVLRFSLENNKNLAWNDIAKLLNNTQKKERKPKSVNEPKCLINSNQVFKTKNEKNGQMSLNKYNLLRKSLNQKADNNQEIENIPVVHENFENIINNYMNNQKNLAPKSQNQQNIRHSFESLPIEKINKTSKNDENEKIRSLNEKYALLFENFDKLQKKNDSLEKEVVLLKENKQYEEMFHQEESKNQKFSIELYLKNEMILKQEEKLKESLQIILNLLGIMKNGMNSLEIAKTLNKISPLLSEFKMENQAKPLYSFLESIKKVQYQSNKENLSANNLTNPVKKTNITQKFMQNLVTSSNYQNPRSSFPHKPTLNLDKCPINEAKQGIEDHNRYIKKLVGLDIAQTIQTVDEPQENLPQIDDISIIKEENPNQITMIEHSEASQNNTFFQKEDPNESSLINYEESDIKNPSVYKRNSTFNNGNSQINDSHCEKETRVTSFHRKPPNNFKKSCSDKGDLKSFDSNHCKSNSFTQHFSIGGENCEMTNAKNDGNNVDFGTAKFEFKGQKSNDLTFIKGDLVQILKRTDNGWWIGGCHNKIGYFPYYFIEPYNLIK